MKRKYYKFTDSYCRRLERVTCAPIRHKFILAGMTNRFSTTCKVSDKGYVPCDGHTIKLPKLSKVL